MSTPLLELRQVGKVFQSGSVLHKSRFRAVSDVDLALYPGEVLGIVGESGSGKSTLARMITNLITPTSGDILLDGDSIVRNKAVQRNLPKVLQMVFQDPFGALNSNHTVGYSVGRPLQIQKRVQGKTEFRQKVIELLMKVGLTPADEFFEKMPHELSGGQKQRVMIARVLGLQPKLIVLDEPTSMLDVSMGIDIMNLLLDLKEEKNLSYIFITHNIASARYMADRIAVMFAGHVMETGHADDVIQHPKHPYTKLLLASSPDPWNSEATTIQLNEKQISRLPESGCAFQFRCPLVTERCRDKKIPNILLEDGRQVRCNLYEVAENKKVSEEQLDSHKIGQRGVGS